MRSRRFLILLFSICAACSAESPKNKTKPAPSSGGLFFKSSPKVVSVTALSVSSREIPLVIAASGRTVVSDRYVAKAPTHVKVQKVLVEEGAKVQAGDPLVKFDDQESNLRVAKARAEIREAEAGVANDNYLKANRDKLIEEGKLSEVEADGLDKRIDLRQATADRAKAEIDLYEKLTNLVQLNSPISGVVTRRNVSDGTEVVEDQELVEVVRLDPIQFVFTVPVDSVSALDKGAEIAVKFLGFPDQEFSGQVASVGAEAGAESGGVPIKLNIPNPELLLKAEMKGDLTLHTPLKKKVFPIAETAIFKSDRSNYVYKIERNKVRKVAVELGGEPFNGQPAVEKGLADGDVIVLSVDTEGLADGAMVEVNVTRAEK